LSDIGLFLVDNCINLKLENGDIALDEGIETSILISVFSDARVSTDELPAGETNRKGWWGDMFPEIENDKIGSKLWLTERGKKTLSVLSSVETSVKRSLKWLIDDGVASSVDVVADFDSNDGITLSIDITKPSDEKNLFKIFWNKQEIKRA